jgi:hypothetical protein
MSCVPEYTRMAIKNYQNRNKELVKKWNREQYWRNAEELNRKRRQRYQQKKDIQLLTVN